MVLGVLLTFLFIVTQAISMPVALAFVKFICIILYIIILHIISAKVYEGLSKKS